jgi:archaellum biogenesis ATPase FlaH
MVYLLHMSQPTAPAIADHELIDGMLPRHEVSILAGASGAGKTTLLMQVLRQLQHNEPVFGRAVQPDLKLGYIAADRTWRAYERLAKQVGVDLDKIHCRALIDDDTIDTDNFEKNPQNVLQGLLADMVKCGVELVIVDPLVVFLGCDTRIYHVNAARLIKLNKLCRNNKITLLGTHHATKARSDYSFKRPQDRINGSGALLGFTSTQLFLAGADELNKDASEWHIISHHAPAAVIYLERDPATGLFREVVGQECLPKDISNFKEDPSDFAAKILNLIPSDGTPVKRDAIADVLKDLISPATVDRHLQRLKSDGVLRAYDSGFYGLALVGGLHV